MMTNVMPDGPMMPAPLPWSALGHGRDAWRGDRVVPPCRCSAPRRVQAATSAGVAAVPAGPGPPPHPADGVPRALRTHVWRVAPGHARGGPAPPDPSLDDRPHGPEVLAEGGPASQ